MAQRQTVQKELIYTALVELGNHPTADQVYDAIRTAHPSISRATVFRVLNQMSENGTVLKVKMTDGADRYDHTVHPHCHGHCLRCRKIFDIPYIRPEMQSFLPEDTGGFRVTDYSIQFFGLCAACKEKEDA